MKNKWVIIVSALLCFLSVAILIPKKPYKKTEAYDVVFFGDSIIASDHNDAWTIPVMFADQMNMTVLNAAVGGSTLCDVFGTTISGDASRIFSMASLAQAIQNDDYSIQVMASQNENNYVDEWRGWVVEQISKIDWNSVRYVIIEQGANDYLTGVPVDDEDDPYNMSTFGGALRFSIEAIAQRTNAKIVILTPIYMFPDGCADDCLSADFGGGTLDKYVEKELEIVKEYNVILIDNFNELDINRYNYQDYIPGGLHGNYDGNKLITDNVVRHLRESNERD